MGMEPYKHGDDASGPLRRLIDVIENAAVAGWGPTVRTAV